MCFTYIFIILLEFQKFVGVQWNESESQQNTFDIEQ